MTRTSELQNCLSGIYFVDFGLAPSESGERCFTRIMRVCCFSVCAACAHVRVCACARARACVCACVRARARVCGCGARASARARSKDGTIGWAN
eukprot:4037993-Alexandrium_andersonii.AAC.1